jgi:hypothetical protein
MHRWLLRLRSYEKALKSLREAVEIYRSREMNPVEEQGLIKAFEYTYELAWNLLKDYLE